MLGPFGLRKLAPLLTVLALAGCAAPAADSGPGQRTTERVTKHTDGDTLWLSGIGKVRLIGVDTPEVYGQVECFGHEASAFVERTVPPNVEYEDLFVRVARRAREAGRGLWGRPGCSG